MKFELDRADGVNLVSRHDARSVRIGAADYGTSILLPWAGAVQVWPPGRFDDLQVLHFELARALQPELVIFGSGRRLRFPAPRLLRDLIEHGIGVETMDTAAACRTFNVLAAEGRRVLAALLLEVEA